MKNDVDICIRNGKSGKILSKETLNNPELIEFVTGLDVFQDTQRAYINAYQALGIDIINRVPWENAPVPCPKNTIKTIPGKPYFRQYLGVFDTVSRTEFACKTVNDVWRLDMEHISYENLITPVPHSCGKSDILKREEVLGNIGYYYPMLYTTLFMWGVEVLGWEIFMEAAISEPNRFHKHFIIPCIEKSRKIVYETSNASSCPFVFLHDDLASAGGPIFPPTWYEEYIFPHYHEIFEPAKAAGKKIIFVADGNISMFLPALQKAGIDGIMVENPATPLDIIIEHFGAKDKFFIGGIETNKLTFGTPDIIKKMVYELIEKTVDIPGFIMASCGGLHGNIPLENLIAYFNARADVGATPENWNARVIQN